MKDLLKEQFLHGILYVRWVVLCLVILYLVSGMYAVSSNETGVLQRFGKVLDDAVQPGIHFALPWPVDRVTKVPIKIVNRIVIDDFYTSSASYGATANIFTAITGLDSYCITGDNNLVNISCVIQFTITDPYKYIFIVKDPVMVLRNMAANTIIHCLAKTTIDDALTIGKTGIARFIKTGLQTRLDELNSGISVSFVELNDIKPPDRVQDAFSDVVKAGMDRIKVVNEAESYRNETLPAAKADATRILQEAEAYKREVVLRAEGDASRFESLLSQVIQGDTTPRTMMYLETMREVMQKVKRQNIVLLDSDGSAPARMKLFLPDTPNIQ